MKFVYFGYDFMLPALQRLIADGHEAIGIFTFECDNIFNFNTETIAFAKEKNIPIILSKPESFHIQEFLDKGAEAFLAAGYPYKIPTIDEQHAYGINLHPAYLPKGRGLMPTPTIIMTEPDAAGMTVHKLTDEIDAGDILYQEKLPLSEHETVETYSSRVAMRAPGILSQIMSNLPTYWDKATKQDEAQASIFPMPDDDMRTLDWSAPVNSIYKKSCAFGAFGSLCYIEGKLVVSYDLAVWEEQHNLEPGSIAHREARVIVVAAQNGFVCLKNFQIVEDTVTAISK